MKNRHRSNPKGRLCHCEICGVIYTGGNRRQNPTAVLKHQWGWAVPGQSLASADFIGKSTISPVSWARAFSSGPPAGCVVCRDKPLCNLQAIVSVLEIFVHEWFICVSGNKLEWPQKHRKTCILDALAMIWLCFLGILGVCSIVWSLLNHRPAQRPGLCELMACAGIGYLQP